MAYFLILLIMPISALCQTATITLIAKVPSKLELKKDYLIKPSKTVQLYYVKTHKSNDETVITISAKY